MAFAATFLFIARALATRQWPRFPAGNVKDTAIIGVLIAAQGGVFNFAMSLVPIANAVIFWSIAPFFVFIFSAIFLGEKARKSYILIFAIALAGIALANPLGGGHMLGNFVALATGAIYAAMVTYMRYEGKTEPGNDIAWSLLVAALSLSPFLLIVGPGQVATTIAHPALGVELPVMLWAAGLGIVSTGFAYFGISIVLKSIDANVYALKKHFSGCSGRVSFSDRRTPAMSAQSARHHCRFRTAFAPSEVVSTTTCPFGLRCPVSYPPQKQGTRPHLKGMAGFPVEVQILAVFVLVRLPGSRFRRTPG